MREAEKEVEIVFEVWGLEEMNNWHHIYRIMQRKTSLSIWFALVLIVRPDPLKTTISSAFCLCYCRNGSGDLRRSWRVMDRPNAECLRWGDAASVTLFLMPPSHVASLHHSHSQTIQSSLLMEGLLDKAIMEEPSGYFMTKHARS